jgi:hypothetical protein
MSNNSTIGSNGGNTSTFNAIPNFVNGFKCNNSTNNIIYTGTATYLSGALNNIQPLSSGTAYFEFDNNKTLITSITGIFINTQSSLCFCSYVNGSLNVSESSIQISITNLSNTNVLDLAQSIQYMIFVPSDF